MPFCPACRTEYRPGFSACADCHVPLVEKLEAPPPETPPGDLVTIFQGPVLKAELVGQLLEMEGIIADVSAVETGVLAAHYVNAAGVVRVMVAERDAAQSRAIIDAARETKPG